jgi:hypothetical protein
MGPCLLHRRGNNIRACFLRGNERTDSAMVTKNIASRSALDMAQKPYYFEIRNSYVSAVFTTTALFGLAPMRSPVHPPPTTAKASALASLMSGVANRKVKSKRRITPFRSPPRGRACGEQPSPCPNRVRPVRPLDEAVLTTRKHHPTGHHPEATPSQRTRPPDEVRDVRQPVPRRRNIRSQETSHPRGKMLK